MMMAPQQQITISILLLIPSLVIACVMLAGSSNDCDVINDVSWGVLEFTVPGLSYTLNVAPGKVCTDNMVADDDNDDFYVLDDDKNDDLPDDDDNDDNNDAIDALNTCSDAGNVSLAFTVLVFILTVMAIVMSIARLRNTTSSGIKVASILPTILAIGCDITAIAYFDQECLSELDDYFSRLPEEHHELAGLDYYHLTRSPTLYAGSVMAFLLALSAVLNAAVSRTTQHATGSGKGYAKY